MSRKLNFSGGPGELPAVVLDQAAEAVRELPGTGLSILGLNHRTPEFAAILEETEENLRTLLGLPRDYHVLFLQGGGSLQFSMVPLHLLRGRQRPAQYIVGGYWSEKSLTDARLEGDVEIVWDGRPEGCVRLPEPSELALRGDAAYLHYISNETVEGLQFHYLPGRDEVPRVVDMSSDFLSRRHDITRFAIAYAHAQKNLGPAGVTVVLVHDDVVRDAPQDLPAMLQYRNHVAMKSVYNTPPVFAIYVTMLVTRWVLHEIGGLAAMEGRNAQKAARLYAALEAHRGFYRPHARPGSRSLMNVAFRLPTPALEELFLKEAEESDFAGLGGHRSIGGLRASLYNAISLEAVETLSQFLADFVRRHG